MNCDVHSSQGVVRKRIVPFISGCSTAYSGFRELSTTQMLSALTHTSVSSIHDMRGTKIRDSSVVDEPVVGEVVAYHASSGLGLAMMRLSSLEKDSGIYMLQMKEESRGDLHIAPFRPSWWPENDPLTGEPLFGKSE